MINERVFRRELEKILKGFYQGGRIPRPIEVETLLKKALEEHPPGEPRLTLRPQERGSRFNLDDFNVQCRELHEDLDILYKLLIDILEAQGTNLSSAISISSMFNVQLDQLENRLRGLILTTKNTGTLGRVVVDSLANLASIDQRGTDATVDIQAKTVTLRRRAKGTKRIPMHHWLQAPQGFLPPRPFIFPRVVLLPNPKGGRPKIAGPVVQPFPVPPGIDQDLIGSLPPPPAKQPSSSLKIVSQTTFADCLQSFQDAGYQLVVASTLGSPLVRIDMRVPQPSQAFVNLSRIDLESIGRMDVRLLYSRDNLDDPANFITFPGWDSAVTVEGRRAFYFEDRQVTWLRLELTKAVADRLDSNADAIYSFGIRNLEFYSQGYAPFSVLQTKTLEPDGGGSIGRVSLEVNEPSLPAGTDIRYFVRLDTDEDPVLTPSVQTATTTTTTLQTDPDNPSGPLISVTTSSTTVVDTSGTRYVVPQNTGAAWRPIAPINRPTPGRPLVVDFGVAVTSPRREGRFRVYNPPKHEVYHSIDFYRLFQLPHQPVYGTARLYPAVGAWKREKSTEVRTRTIRNNYLVFASDDTGQYLYLTARDEESAVRTESGETTLDLRHQILQSEGMPLTPTRTAVLQHPVYSVERVLRHTSSGTSSEASGTSGRLVRLADRNPELFLGVTLTTPTGYVDQFVYLSDGTESGYFRVVDYYPASAETVLVLEDVDISMAATGLTWRLDYHDVTSHVRTIRGRTVLMNSDMPKGDQDRFLVTYRHKLATSQQLVGSSVRLRTPGSDIELVAGRDFEVDQDRKLINRLSINTGSGTNLAVEADYEIRESAGGLERYTLFVDLAAARSLTVASIVVDRAVGEYARVIPVHSSAGEIRDASAAGTWNLEGIMAFVIGSRPLFNPDGVVDTNSAIYKMINRSFVAVGSGGSSMVFDPGQVFLRTYPDADPMEQTTKTILRGRYVKDYGQFYVQDRFVVVNFDPAKRSDLVTLLPGNSSEESYLDFEIGYQYVPTISKATGVLLRAELSRGLELDGSVTPVLAGFTVRYS